MLMSIHVTMHYRFANPNIAFLALEAARTDGQTILSESLSTGDAELTRIAGDADIGERSG